VTVYTPPVTTYYDYSYSYPTVTETTTYYGSSYTPYFDYGWGY